MKAANWRLLLQPLTMPTASGHHRGADQSRNDLLSADSCQDEFLENEAAYAKRTVFTE